jgi:hypothetical protein
MKTTMRKESLVGRKARWRSGRAGADSADCYFV